MEMVRELEAQIASRSVVSRVIDGAWMRIKTRQDTFILDKDIIISETDYWAIDYFDRLEAENGDLHAGEWHGGPPQGVQDGEDGEVRPGAQANEGSGKDSATTNFLIFMP